MSELAQPDLTKGQPHEVVYANPRFPHHFLYIDTADLSPWAEPDERGRMPAGMYCPKVSDPSGEMPEMLGVIIAPRSCPRSVWHEVFHAISDYQGALHTYGYKDWDEAEKCEIIEEICAIATELVLAQILLKQSMEELRKEYTNTRWVRSTPAEGAQLVA